MKMSRRVFYRLLGASAATPLWAARGEASCAVAPSSMDAGASPWVDAVPDIASGKVFVGPYRLKNGSASQPYSINRIGDSNRRLRFEVRTGDRASWDFWHGAYVDRSEVYAGDASSRVAYGSKFWWTFSMLVEDGAPLTGDWCVIGQLHQSAVHPRGYGANPPFAFSWHSNGSQGLSILTRASSLAQATARYVRPERVYVDDQFPRGVWVKWWLELRFDWRGDALLKVWRDDHLVVNRSGSSFAMGYEWDAGPDNGVYCQFGIYRASAARGNPWRQPDAAPMAVQYADFDFGLGDLPCRPPE